MKLDHSLTLYTKINLQWIKDLNVRQVSIRILEENIGSNLFDISHSNFFQDMSPKETKAKMNLRDFIKIKSFCTAKEIVKKTKRQPTEWEKIFANDSTDKRLMLISRMTDAGEDAENGAPTYTVGGNASWCNLSGKQHGGSSKC